MTTRKLLANFAGNLLVITKKYEVACNEKQEKWKYVQISWVSYVFFVKGKGYAVCFFFNNLMLQLNVKKKQLNVRIISNLALRTNPLEQSCCMFALKSLSKQL